MNSASTTAPVILGRPGLRVHIDAPMSIRTTWRIGGPADFLIMAGTRDDVLAVVDWCRTERIPLTTIGGGSNLLVGDRGIRGAVMLVRTPGERAEHLLTASDHGNSVQLRVGAQAPLSWVGRYAAERGWGGLDWAVGLPGTVGGATVNNAGAHGTEVTDAFESVVIVRDDGAIEEHDRTWLDPKYRYTSIKAASRPRGVHVLETVFRLPKSDRATLVELADQHAEYRHRTQPTGPCAGSTFANPPGDFAGRLLEASGMKGFAVGDVSFSTVHSNFIVNSGKASASHVRELIATGQERVKSRFGVDLEREIEEVGEF